MLVTTHISYIYDVTSIVYSVQYPLHTIGPPKTIFEVVQELTKKVDNSLLLLHYASESIVSWWQSYFRSLSPFLYLILPSESLASFLGCGNSEPLTKSYRAPSSMRHPKQPQHPAVPAAASIPNFPALNRLLECIWVSVSSIIYGRSIAVPLWQQSIYIHNIIIACWYWLT